MYTLRKYLIAGLLVWLPLGATVVIIRLVIGLLDRTVLLLPPEYRPEQVLGFSVPGLGLVLSVAILLLTGMLAANLLGRRLVALWEAILGRIPLVRTIYNAVKQISTTILDSSGKSFRKVVMVEYPRAGVWSMGFLTNPEVAVASGATADGLVTVFIPTTPNPTSGFIIMLPDDKVRELDMSVEDGVKFIISMGVIVPAGPLRITSAAGAVAQSAADS